MPLPGLRDKDIDILRSTLRHFSFVQEVRVFGSRAHGIARRSSDLDLAISSPEATPAEWAELYDALQNMPIIYALDIVRPERMANERLKAKIAREGVTIYPEKAESRGRAGSPSRPVGEQRRSLKQPR